MASQPISLVIDSGPFSCKIGWSFSATPTSEIAHVSSLSLHPPDHQTDGSKTVTPLDSTHLESLWYTAVQDYNRFKDHFESPILLFDSRIRPEDRTSVAEFFFEVVGAPSILLPPEGLILTAALKRLQFLPTTDPKVNSLPPQSSDEGRRAQLDSPFTGVIVNTGYESIRLYSCLSGYTSPEPSQLFPVGGRIATDIIFSHMHRQPPNKSSSAIQRLTQVPKLFRRTQRNSIQQLHHCCSKLCRFLFEKRCFVSDDPLTDLLEVQGFSSTSSEGRYPLSKVTSDPFNASLSGPQQLASIFPFWHSCPLRTRRSRPSQCSNCGNLDSSEFHLETASEVSSSGSRLSLTTRLTGSQESTSADSTPHPSKDSLQGADVLQETAFRMTYQCCICTAPHGSRMFLPMHLKQYQNTNPSQNIEDKRSRYPKYLNLLGDHMEMMSREHFLQLLNQGPLLDQKIKQLMHETLFMSPEIFFSPAYVSQILGSNVTDLRYLEDRKGLADCVVSIFNDTPIDCKRQVYSNVVLLGSIAGLPGFSSRMLIELKKALEHHFHATATSSSVSLDRISLRVLVPSTAEERRFASWTGLKELWLNQIELNRFSITKSDVSISSQELKI